MIMNILDLLFQNSQVATLRLRYISILSVQRLSNFDDVLGRKKKDKTGGILLLTNWSVMQKGARKKPEFNQLTSINSQPNITY